MAAVLPSFFVWVKKGRVKKYFISCAVSGSKIF